jgi:uncharacterized FAD-dependent dehydrogenase
MVFLASIIFYDLLLFTTLSNAFVRQPAPLYSPVRNSLSWTQRVPRIPTGTVFLPVAKSDSIDTTDQSSPSKKRKSKGKTSRPKQKNGSKSKVETWRVFGVQVHPDDLEPETTKVRPVNATSTSVPTGKKFLTKVVSDAVFSRLRSEPKQIMDIRVVRRSLDARHKRRSDGSTGPRFDYVIDVDVRSDEKLRLRHQPGRLELLSSVDGKQELDSDSKARTADNSQGKKRVVIVGAGPAGLFCALKLARAGVIPILLERGQPVESRGKDIGALMHRRSLDSESNFAFGEGGAGTWSDGKLTTRIGRNSDAVRFVLETLVEYGAPEIILVEGAPHLGTDNLVRLLRNMRSDLRRLGGEIRFGTKMTGLVIEDGVAVGVDVVTRPALERNMGDTPPIDDLPESGRILGDAVVLATGHSARDVYEQLHECGVQLEPKGFAVGFRVEHPQKLINKIQYGSEWGATVVTGKSTTDSENQRFFQSSPTGSAEDKSKNHSGTLPVPSYRLATDKAFDGNTCRGVYSFCMCPGGQIVPASTDPTEMVVNGMSFSRRDSLWANSALVVTVAPDDIVLDSYRKEKGVMAGIAFQRDMERKAAELGGGNLIVPVQRLTDFIAGRPSTTAPSSSYRLGVKPAACHEIYPPALVASLRHALTEFFDRKMPGYVSDEGLLHGVETRTSSPVRVSRDAESLQAIGTKLLFPAGEGAGFAGGIVSAAVDGMTVAEAVLEALVGDERNGKELKNAMKSIGSFY